MSNSGSIMPAGPDSETEVLHQPEPSDRRLLLSAVGWIGVFFIFALIVFIAYVQQQPREVGTVDQEARFQIRYQTEATQKELVTSYSWVNQAEGVVRIPVERAIELTLEELEPATPPVE